MKIRSLEGNVVIEERNTKAGDNISYPEKQLLSKYLDINRVSNYSCDSCETCNNCGSGDCASCCGSTDD